MKTNIEVLELEKDDIVCILSGFTSYGGYWSILSWDDDQYDKAKVKERLLLDKDEDIVCFEDVLANMLMNGGMLAIFDVEEDFEEQTLTLTKLIEGLNLSIKNNGLSMSPEDWDGPDCDIIIQNAIFGEIVFG